jgi:cytochrome c5
MGWVKRIAIAGAVGAAGVVAVAAGGLLWARTARDAKLARTFEVHRADFPIPTPLAEAEIAALRAEKLAAMPPADPAAPVDPAAAPVDPLAGVDLAAVATERAAARGKHLVESRYVCIECHGKDFGGGSMIDDPMVGRIRGYNLTLGQGGVTATYTAADWDRKVRHGVDPSGRGGIMPSDDYFLMSDQELADVVAYIRSMPAVDREVPPHDYGPLGTVLVAAGEIPFAAESPHQKSEHRVYPPVETDPEFGAHLLNVCVGCHRSTFEGGPIPGGPPDWAPSANLTPGPEGLGDWTYEQFEAVLRTGRKPNGEEVKMPMSLITKYGANLTDRELRAAWEALRQVPPRPDGT